MSNVLNENNPCQTTSSSHFFQYHGCTSRVFAAFDDDDGDFMTALDAAELRTQMIESGLADSDTIAAASDGTIARTIDLFRRRYHSLNYLYVRKKPRNPNAEHGGNNVRLPATPPLRMSLLGQTLSSCQVWSLTWEKEEKD